MQKCDDFYLSYVVPIRLSTLDSTLFWNNWGVVVDEKVDAIITCVSGEYLSSHDIFFSQHVLSYCHVHNLLLHVRVDHGGLGRSLLPHQQTSMPILGDKVDQELGPNRTDIGNQQGTVHLVVIRHQ